jgi:antitoxin HigA-1
MDCLHRVEAMPKTSRLSTITEDLSAMRTDPLGPVHPGEILREEVLEPLAMSPYALAAQLHVPRTRIERLVREETPITPDTALRLARYLGTTAEFWLRLQARYDLETARQGPNKDIAAIRPRKTA